MRRRRRSATTASRRRPIEAFLLDQARKTGFPATIIHPGHIVGPGWAPLNPAGNFNPAVFSTLARGERLTLPNFGLETVHHVHADDVAGLIMAAIENWRAATGESFNAVSGGALTLRGFAEGMADWFGRTRGSGVRAVRDLGQGAERSRPDRHLGAYRPQPELLDGEGAEAAWVRAEVYVRSRPSRRRSPR